MEHHKSKVRPVAHSTQGERAQPTKKIIEDTRRWRLCC